MKSYSQIDQIRSHLHDLRLQSPKIALVPTMGFLHDGHLSLIRKAKSENDFVVVSIFVNPAQFAPNEDFARYPRDMEKDTVLAKVAGCDIIFSPSVVEMYPDGYSTYVDVEGLSSRLEGKFRPTHFKGVATVVAKLINIVQPDNIYFGQKDAQQCALIKKMVTDLNLPLNIVIMPTMRESDGLAMSSRNVYLSAVERKNATVLFEALKHAELAVKNGERRSDKIISMMTDLIRSKDPTTIDYIEIVEDSTLQPKSMIMNGDDILIPLAVRFGTTRLIDNIIIHVPV